MDSVCPVCGQSTKDARGLASHFRFRREAGDTAHPEYQALQWSSQEGARWAGGLAGLVIQIPDAPSSPFP